MTKQNTIVRQKLWDAKLNSKLAVFPTDFYSQKEILIGLNSFDLNNVSFSIKRGKTDKGFKALIVSFF